MCKHLYLVYGSLLYPQSERSETGRYTVFTSVCVCLSVCVSVRTHLNEWAEWRIVCQEMYSTRVRKVDNISVRTRFCWKCHFIAFLTTQSGSRSKWGFTRNVKNATLILCKMDLPQHTVQRWRHGIGQYTVYLFYRLWASRPTLMLSVRHHEWIAWGRWAQIADALLEGDTLGRYMHSLSTF